MEIEIVLPLMKCFPKSFINHNGEFIAHEYSNQYFSLKDCKSIDDLKCKVIESFSRPAYKSIPYNTEKSNSKFHKFFRDGVNKFLGTDFDEDDFELIYTYLGNRCNHDLTVAFVESGFNLDVLKERQHGKL